MLVHQTRHKKNMRTTKHKLGYRLVLCLVVLMFFFSDSSDEQAFGFSASYNKAPESSSCSLVFLKPHSQVCLWSLIALFFELLHRTDGA